MKTKRTRQATSSTSEAGHRIVDVKLPESWQQLSQCELMTVYQIMAIEGVTEADVRAMVFCTLTGAKVERHDGDPDLLQLAFPQNRWGRVRLRISSADLAELLSPLDFLFNDNPTPVRLQALGGCQAVDAELHGLSFGNYIRLENLYNGLIRSKDQTILCKIVEILYPGFEGELSPAERLNVMNWVVSAKNLLSRTFKNFFRPAGPEGKAPDMLAVMNNEIRALSGGDPTKEAAVLELDCWRALTELDFKAKEAEDFDRRMKQNK